jgi:Tol biopolymer transport system component
LKLADLGRRSMLWWSPDGKSLLMPASDAENQSGLYLIDVHMGAVSPVVPGSEREVYSGGANALAVSPDGKHLALIEYLGSPSRAQLLILPIDGGEPHELLSEPGYYDVVDWHAGLSWMPDGSGLLYGKTVRQGSSAVRELWYTSVADGEARKIDLTMEVGMWDVRLHPDGRRIAFAGGSPFAWEVWVMENLLPPMMK